SFRKTDLTQGPETLREPHTKTKFAAVTAPSRDQFTGRLAHRDGHFYGTLGGVGARHRIIEEHHYAVARELVERAFELAHQRPQSAMVLTQELQHLLRLGGLGEGGVAAQIAEHHNDFAAMAFEDLLVTLRDDQFGKLRSEEPLQPADAAQFVNLLGDPRFEPAIEFADLLGALAQFANEPHVLHRDHRLRCEVFEQRNLLFREWPRFLANGGDHAKQSAFSAQWREQQRADALGFGGGARRRVVGG